MARSIIPQSSGDVPRNRAEIDIIWAMTADGLPWPIPATVVAWMQMRGQDSISPPKLYLRPPINDSTSHLTITQAAHEHLDDVPPFDACDRRYQLDAARKRILRACNRGDIVTAMIDGKLRIDRNSFTAWRLCWRQKTLDESDDA